MLFKVMNKDTGVLEVVYKVKEFNENESTIKFLIYKGEQWVWCLANEFKPVKYPFIFYK